MYSVWNQCFSLKASPRVAVVVSQVCVLATPPTPGDGRESPKTRVYSPLMTSTQFMELAQLCSDQAILATHLLSMAKALSSSEQPTANSRHCV